MRGWIGWIGVTAMLGCNMITGAGDIVLVDRDNPGDEQPGGGGSSLGAGGSGHGTAGGDTGSGAGGDSSQPLSYADGAAVTDIDLYQAIRRPLVQAGAPLTSDIPIVAQRSAMVRVFYATDGSYDGQPVTARLTLGGALPLEVTVPLGPGSSQADLGSTLNLEVPGDLLTPGLDFKVELLQPSGSGANNAAAYPAGGGSAPLDVQQGGVKLKLLLVPVENNGSLPDTSPGQVERYVRFFSEQYPVPEVEVNVRAGAYSFGGDLGSYNGWSQLLDEITDLRDSDGAPADVYYYGIHDADSGGLLGLGWVGGSNDVWSRTAIGVGWSGDTAPGTAVHEVGHNHGRDHSPCGVSGDPSYPHPGAVLGVWGYSPSQHKLLDPNQYVDFMSYCDPAWISDYTYKAIFQRAKVVSSQPDMAVPDELVGRSYDRIKVLDGVARWKDVVTLSHPPLGTPVPVEVSSGRRGAHTLTGNYYAYDHIEGGILYVMRSRAERPADRIRRIQFQAEGQTFVLSR